MITTPQNRVFGRKPLREGYWNLTLIYKSVTSAGSEPLWLLNSTFLQIGNITFPHSGIWNFCISEMEGENCIDIESTAAKSLLLSVPSEENYSIRALKKD
jgi:hypothetical protein